MSDDKVYHRAGIYVVAHQDDWQLFMDPDISRDITDPRCRTVIVHVTAGDAGRPRAYWLARERAAIASLLFRMSGQVAQHSKAGYRSLRGRRVRYAEAGNCITYFLRLPDGNAVGEGFERYHYQSLERLRTGKISELTSVDEGNTFHRFEDIVNMLDDLLSREAQMITADTGNPFVLHFPEYDPEINPMDHIDHFNTAELIRASGFYEGWLKKAYVHYHIQHISLPLKGEELFWKVGMFSVYQEEMRRLQKYSTIGETAAYFAWASNGQVYRQIH